MFNNGNGSKMFINGIVKKKLVRKNGADSMCKNIVRNNITMPQMSLFQDLYKLFQSFSCWGTV